MKYLLSVLLVLAALTFISYKAERKTGDCKDVQKGEFYFYPKASDKKYKLIRNGKFQREINLGAGDTSVYKITWIDDCNYTLEYVSGKAKLSDNVRQHKIAIQFQQVAINYYISKVCLDSINSPYCLTDTVWFKPK